MIEKELEEKLEKFLKNNKRKYYEDSVSYSGLREMKMIDSGDLKKLYLVNFMVSISDQKYDSDAFYMAAFDEKTHKMLFIIGPQSYEKIEE